MRTPKPLSVKALYRACDVRQFDFTSTDELDDISADGILSVKLSGACGACPNMAMTYVGLIRSYLMEVTGVREVLCEQVRASPRSLARIARLLGARSFPH